MQSEPLPDDDLIPAIHQLQHQASKQGMLLMWTIYHKPKDFPEEMVARCFAIGGAGAEPLATSHVIRGKTLRGLQRVLRKAGLVSLARHTDDDPVIVETWL